MDFIVDTNIDLNKINTSSINLDLNLSQEDISQFIANIIKKIYLNYQDITGNDINRETFTNKCDLLTAVAYYNFVNYGFNCYPLETHKVISNDVLGHSLLMIEYNDFKYLVDLTYKQFFLKENCQDKNYFIKNGYVLLAPHPGYYYLKHPEYLPVAQKILEDGFIEATEENLKIYLDSFYKTKRGKIDNMTSISGKVYLNACNFSSSSVNHSQESLDAMGFKFASKLRGIKR